MRTKKPASTYCERALAIHDMPQDELLEMKALIRAEERSREAWNAARHIWTYLDTNPEGGFPRNWHLELKVWDKQLRDKISRDSFRWVADNLRAGLSPVKGLLLPAEEAALGRCSY